MDDMRDFGRRAVEKKAPGSSCSGAWRRGGDGGVSLWSGGPWEPRCGVCMPQIRAHHRKALCEHGNSNTTNDNSERGSFKLMCFQKYKR